MFSACLAREPNWLEKEYQLRTWTTENGFLSNRVQSLLQTSDGYLWIGTPVGLVRFDGIRFTVLSSENSPLPANLQGVGLAEDQSGFLWICWRSGLIRYRAGEFEDLGLHDGLRGREIEGFYMAESGRLWIETDRGLNYWFRGEVHKFIDPQITAYDPAASGNWGISGICEESERYVWLSNGYATIRNDLLGQHAGIVLSQGNGVKTQSIERDSNGNMWTLDSTGLQRWNNGEWLNYAAPMPERPPYFNFFQFDHRGNVWYAAPYLGLVRFDGVQFDVASTNDGLPDNHVICMEEDREGNIWLGTSDSGLVRLLPRRLRTLTERDGLPDDNGRAICESRDGSMWVGTDGGLSRFEPGEGGGTPAHYSTNDGLQINTVRSVLEDRQGSVWVGNEFGLDRLDAGVFESLPVPGDREKFECAVRVIYEDRSGALWYGSRLGLHRIQGGEFRTFSTDDGLSANEPRAILEPSWSPERTRELWVGTLDGGLNHFVFADEASDPEITIYAMLQGLSADRVTALFEGEEGVLWIGTSNGLNRLKNGRVAVMTSDDGLHDNWINAILDDGFGNFWMSSQKGVFHVSKEELNLCADGVQKSISCVVYDQSEGLPTQITNGAKSQPAGWKSQDGKLWFVTPKGVAVVDPKLALETEVPPLVVVEKVRANGRVLFDNSVFDLEKASFLNEDWKPEFASLESKVELPPGSAQVLEIHYTANTFVAPDKAKFRYRMHGFDTNWVEGEKSRVAYYTNLRPGDYQFQVAAADHRGIWNEVGAPFAFSIAPYFYETGAFVIVSGLVVSLAVLGIYRLRIGVLKRIHDLEHRQALALDRARISRDIHDDLGAQLTQIRGVTELLSDDLSRRKIRSDSIGEIMGLSGRMFDSLEEIVWALNPQNDRLERFLARLRKTAVSLLDRADLAKEFDWPKKIPDLNVSPSLRRHLILVMKEAIHNVIQHSDATRVWIRVSLQGKRLLIQVRDDGRGFDVRQVSEEGNGLPNMQERTKLICGALEITSAPGKGTVVQIEVVLSPDEC